MMKAAKLLGAGFFLFVSAAVFGAVLAPPVADIKPTRLEAHGDVRVDNYYWLREKETPAVLDYLKAENQYSNEVMKSTQALQDQLFNEFKSRVIEDKTDVPEKRGAYYYYHRYEAGKQYAIHCRKLGDLSAPEEVLLDENELAQGHDFFSLDGQGVSPNHKWLAYGVNTTGSFLADIHFKNLETGETLAYSIDQVPVWGAIVWANDNQTIFYVKPDAAFRSSKLYRHRIGDDPAQDPLLYEEKDSLFNLGIQRSRSGQYLMMTSASFDSSETRILSADNPSGDFKLFQARQANLNYTVYHLKNEFLVLTNYQAPNYRLMTTSLAATEMAHWRQLLPTQPNIKMSQMIEFENHFVVIEVFEGDWRYRVVQRSDMAETFITFPDAAYAAFPDGENDYHGSKLRLYYSSFLTPDSKMEYDIFSRRLKLLHQDSIPDIHPERYEVKRVWAPTRDGKRVPIDVVHAKGLQLDGSHKLLLDGYGAYGFSIPAFFNSKMISLLERGFIFARANVRGSDALGEGWYNDGRMLNKKNTFYDFIDSAEFLIDEGYTSSNTLAAVGGSAGGLLMGAVANMRPELFKVILAHVPFVDVLTTMSDPTIPLTTQEYEQWGNPAIEEHYNYIKSYSPYDNVVAQDYPHMLITGGYNDSAVQYFEPTKWTAKLRAHKTDQNTLLLKINMGAGHGGDSGRYAALKEEAFNYAFLLEHLK